MARGRSRVDLRPRGQVRAGRLRLGPRLGGEGVSIKNELVLKERIDSLANAAVILATANKGAEEALEALAECVGREVGTRILLVAGRLKAARVAAQVEVK